MLFTTTELFLLFKTTELFLLEDTAWSVTSKCEGFALLLSSFGALKYCLSFNDFYSALLEVLAINYISFWLLLFEELLLFLSGAAKKFLTSGYYNDALDLYFSI